MDATVVRLACQMPGVATPGGRSAVVDRGWGPSRSERNSTENPSDGRSRLTDTRARTRRENDTRPPESPPPHPRSAAHGTLIGRNDPPKPGIWEAGRGLLGALKTGSNPGQLT